jgi:uncharacterized membrane protein HdeD (DUF308 family)
VGQPLGPSFLFDLFAHAVFAMLASGGQPVFETAFDLLLVGTVFELVGVGILFEPFVGIVLELMLVGIVFVLVGL